jgi:hypothetical protein
MASDFKKEEPVQSISTPLAIVSVNKGKKLLREPGMFPSLILTFDLQCPFLRTRRQPN